MTRVRVRRDPRERARESGRTEDRDARRAPQPGQTCVARARVVSDVLHDATSLPPQDERRIRSA
jgi:hypothetical protein